MVKYKRRVSTRITEEMLLHLLGLNPHDFTLSGVTHDIRSGTIDIFIDGDSLPQAVEGQEIPIKNLDFLKEEIKRITETSNG